MEIKKSAAKDKGKGKMDETESPRKMKQKERAQISKDEEVAQKLQEEFDAVERQEGSSASSSLGFFDVNGMRYWLEFIADEDFVQRLHAVLSYEEKPITPTQQKDYMLNYIKNQEGGYSIKQLKSLSFEQLEVQTLERAGQEVLEKPVKRQKIGEASGSGEEQSAKKGKQRNCHKKNYDELLVDSSSGKKNCFQPLQVRYPIIDWEVYSEDTRRDDLFKLWDLVKEKFSTTEPTDDKEKELWVELKKLFELDIDDILCKLQRYMHDPLVWRLYDTCGVHHVSSVRGHDIFMLVEKEYPLTRGTLG
ncbi:hypothetical protein Tco_1105345 [Tanacetum coccineum]